MATVTGPQFGFFDSGDFRSFLFQIQRGAVPGYTYKQRHVFCSEASSSYFSTFWSANTPSLYNFLAAPQTLQISSTHAQDTAAGTGARTVLISGLDANYDTLTETITLNGQTPVTTVNQFFRINDLECQTYGTDQRNRGNIYLGSGTVSSGVNSNPQSFIGRGAHISEVGVFTVPRGYALISFDYELGVSANKELTYRSRVRTDPASPWVTRAGLSLQEKTNTPFETTTSTIYEMRDIELQVIANAPNAVCTADFQTALVDVKFLT